MKRWMKWSIPVVVVVLIGGFAARTLLVRKNEAAAVARAASAPPAAIELSPGDVVRLAPRELTRTLAITGSLKAVNTAYVKAKVARN